MPARSAAATAARARADVEVDRLFAEDRLAGGGAGLDQVGMRVGRARDQQRIDAGVGEHGLRVGDGGARCRGDPAAAAAASTSTTYLRRAPRVRGDVRRVDPADAAGAKEREGLHACGAASRRGRSAGTRS